MEPLAPLFLHHVGFVVAEIQAGMEAFVASLGATWNGTVYQDPLQKVRVAFLTTRAGDAQIELVTPDGPDSPVRRFLEENGRACIMSATRWNDLEKQMMEMKSRGALTMRRPKPAVAFEGRPIAWMLTREKLLVELLERR